MQLIGQRLVFLADNEFNFESQDMHRVQLSEETDEAMTEAEQKAEAALRYSWLPERKFRVVDHLLRGTVEPKEVPQLQSKLVRIYVASSSDGW